MGVRGLTGELAGKGIPLDLTAFAAQHVATHGQPLVVLVDGLALVFYLVRDLSTLDVALPSYDLVRQRVLQWVSQLLRSSIRPVFYFDTPGASAELSGYKQATLCSRKEQQIELIVHTIDRCNGLADAAALAHRRRAARSTHSGAPRSSSRSSEGSLHPPMVVAQAQCVFRELQCQMVMCMGEADFSLARDAAALQTFVLSLDSDFCIFSNIFYVPISSIEFVVPELEQVSQHAPTSGNTVIRCQYYHHRMVSELLGVSENLLPLLSALVGNDFTSPFLEDPHLNITAKLRLRPPRSSSNMPSFSACVALIREMCASEAKRTAFQSLCDEYPAFGQAVRYTFASFQAPEFAIDVCPPDLEPLWLLVQQQRLPTSALGVARKAHFSTSVVVEELLGNATPVQELLVAWQAASVALLGVPHEEFSKRQRVGVRYQHVELKFAHYLPPDYPRALPHELLPLERKLWLMQSPMAHNFGRFFDGNKLSPPDALLLQHALPSSSTNQAFVFVALSLQYLFTSSAELADALMAHEVAAIFASAAVLLALHSYRTMLQLQLQLHQQQQQQQQQPTYQQQHHLQQLQLQVQLISEPVIDRLLADILQPWTADDLPSARCLTLASRHQSIVDQLRNLWLVSRMEEVCPRPPPQALFHGPLFRYLLQQARTFFPRASTTTTTDSGTSNNWPFASTNSCIDVLCKGAFMADILASFSFLSADLLTATMHQLVLLTVQPLLYHQQPATSTSTILASTGIPSPTSDRSASLSRSRYAATLSERLADFDAGQLSILIDVDTNEADEDDDEEDDDDEDDEGEEEDDGDKQVADESNVKAKADDGIIGDDDDEEEDDDEDGDGEREESLVDEEIVEVFERQVLPIREHRSEILECLLQHRVIAVQGETGCGKSSQVPQYILEQWREQGSSGRRPLVIVTQPRRIAAITLARRVAVELGEPLGWTVGYAIGQDFLAHRGRQPSMLLFVTSGWLLHKLLHQTEFFAQCTHIVLDEIHERSIDSDLLYLLIRQLYFQSLDTTTTTTSLAATTKLVLMSATFNTQLFADYFRAPAPHAPVPVRFVGVRRFHVEIVHLDELNHALQSMPIFAEFRQLPSTSAAALQLLAQRFDSMLPDRSRSPNEAQLKAVSIDLILTLTRAHADDAAGNCILVFLPGMFDIEDMYESIQEMLRGGSRLARRSSSNNNTSSRRNNNTAGGDDDDDGGDDEELLPLDAMLLHSQLEPEDQLRVFEDIPAGRTRVILSTNIAESSVTIPNVRYVIDFGMMRQLKHDPRAGATTLDTVWVSQASAQQRSGRCGRLFPGVTFRLYSRSFFERLDVYEVPEMLRLSLANTVLRLKLLAEEADENSPFCNARETLRNAIQAPPSDRVDLAVIELLEGRALELDQYRAPPPAWATGKKKNDDDDDDDEDDDDDDDGDELVRAIATNDWELSNSDDDDDDDRYNRAKVPEQRDLLVESHISHLGRFQCLLPLDLSLSRLVALGARSGRHILHCLVMAVGLSVRELFVMPHPSTGAREYQGIVLQTNLGRNAYDMGDQSDALLLVRMYLAYNEKHRYSRAFEMAREYAVNLVRVRQFVRTVSEVASSLQRSMPEHAQWLAILARVSVVPITELRRALSLEPSDVTFLRFLLTQAFLRNGLMVGKTKNAAGSAQKLHERFANAAGISNKQQRGKKQQQQQQQHSPAALASAAAVAKMELANTLVIEAVPEVLMSSEVLLQALPEGLREHVKAFAFGPTALPPSSRKEVLQPWEEAAKRVGPVAIEFQLDQTTERANLLATITATYMPLRLAPAGLRAMLSMFHNGQLTLVLPDGGDGSTNGTAASSNGNGGGNRSRRREGGPQQQQPARGRELVLLKPGAIGISWESCGGRKVRVDQKTSIVRALQPSTLMHPKSSLLVYGVTGNVILVPTAMVDRATVIPQHQGLLAVSLLAWLATLPSHEMTETARDGDAMVPYDDLTRRLSLACNNGTRRDGWITEVRLPVRIAQAAVVIDPPIAYATLDNEGVRNLLLESQQLFEHAITARPSRSFSPQTLAAVLEQVVTKACNIEPPPEALQALSETQRVLLTPSQMRSRSERTTTASGGGTVASSSSSASNARTASSKQTRVSINRKATTSVNSPERTVLLRNTTPTPVAAAGRAASKSGSAEGAASASQAPKSTPPRSTAASTSTSTSTSKSNSRTSTKAKATKTYLAQASELHRQVYNQRLLFHTTTLRDSVGKVTGYIVEAITADGTSIKAPPIRKLSAAKERASALVVSHLEKVYSTSVFVASPKPAAASATAGTTTATSAATSASAVPPSSASPTSARAPTKVVVAAATTPNKAKVPQSAAAPATATKSSGAPPPAPSNGGTKSAARGKAATAAAPMPFVARAEALYREVYPDAAKALKYQQRVIMANGKVAAYRFEAEMPNGTVLEGEQRRKRGAALEQCARRVTRELEKVVAVARK